MEIIKKLILLYQTAQSGFELNEMDAPFPDLQQNRIAVSNMPFKYFLVLVF